MDQHHGGYIRGAGAVRPYFVMPRFPPPLPASFISLLYSGILYSFLYGRLACAWCTQRTPPLRPQLLLTTANMPQLPGSPVSNTLSKSESESKRRSRRPGLRGPRSCYLHCPLLRELQTPYATLHHEERHVAMSTYIWVLIRMHCAEQLLNMHAGLGAAHGSSGVTPSTRLGGRMEP